MSQIATRNDVNSKCNGSMSSGVDCPTKTEILSTHLVGVKGTYGDNECVKIEDLEVGTRMKPIRVTIESQGGTYIDHVNIRPSGRQHLGIHWAPGKNEIDQNGYFEGSDPNDTVCLDIGNFTSARKVTWYDSYRYPGGYQFGKSNGLSVNLWVNWNEWVNNVTYVSITAHDIYS